MAGTNVTYTPTTPAEIAAAKASERTALLKRRLTGTYDTAINTPGEPGAESPSAQWLAQQKELSGLTDDQLHAKWRNRALQRAQALPEDAADIALRDMETGRVTRARRGSRRESMLLGDFNAMPAVGGSSLLGG